MLNNRSEIKVDVVKLAVVRHASDYGELCPGNGRHQLVLSIGPLVAGRG